MEKLEYKEPSNPRWITDKLIAIDVIFPHLSVIDEKYATEKIQFNASADDSYEHGRELYARAIAGDFGPIAPLEGAFE